MASKKSSNGKETVKKAVKVFLATLQGKRILYDAIEGKPDATVPEDTTVGEFAAANGFEIIARSAAKPEAAAAYLKQWFAEHRPAKKVVEQKAEKPAKKVAVKPTKKA